MYEKFNLFLLNHATVLNYCCNEVLVDKIFLIGARETAIIENNKIKNISLSEARSKSHYYRDLLKRENDIYITFDIDYFDPVIAPATAYTIPNGVFFEETIKMLTEILDNKRIIGVDIVEVNPKKVGSTKTMLLASKLILQLINFVKEYEYVTFK